MLSAITEFPPVIVGGLLVAIATTFGSALVFTLRRIRDNLYAVIIGFCAGMMAYASIEMLNESHSLVGHQPAFISFLVGLAFFAAVNRLLPHAHGMLTGTSISPAVHKTTMLVGAIMLHNIPEGFAVAAAFAHDASLGWLITLTIALQDIPEGLIVSAPVAARGVSTHRSFFLGLLSGIVEFLAVIAGYLFLSTIVAITPLALGFSAGAMFYIAFFELMPDAMISKKRPLALTSVIVGLAMAYGIAALIGLR